MKDSYVFISYSRRDKAFVQRLTDSLLTAGIQVWTDFENIAAGSDWQRETERALRDASALIFVASRDSIESSFVRVELQSFEGTRKPIFPIVLDDEGARFLRNELPRIQWLDFRQGFDAPFRMLAGGFSGSLQQSKPIERTELKSKGYIFVSYAAEDGRFVDRLKHFLSERGYAYWDYQESERKYNLDYSLELEDVIKEAVATFSVISPNWKLSSTSMQEFHFSKDVGVPVYLLRIGDPGPTLLLSGMTYIDFTQNMDNGFVKLDRELKRNGLF